MVPLKKLSFKFELAWLKEPDFVPIVKKIWESPCFAKTSLDMIQIKLKRFKQYFKGCDFNRQGMRRKNKNEIHEELLYLEQHEEEGLLTLDQMIRKAHLIHNIMKINEEEELYWFKRSHEKWLLEGDNNTDFFIE